MCHDTLIRKKLHTDQIRVIFAFISTHSQWLSLFPFVVFIPLLFSAPLTTETGLKERKKEKRQISCIVSFDCQLIAVETLVLIQVWFKRFLTNEQLEGWILIDDHAFIKEYNFFFFEILDFIGKFSIIININIDIVPLIF